MIKRVYKVKCETCGKLLCWSIPIGGDGSLVKLRKHNRLDKWLVGKGSIACERREQ